jgi:hypothetical protein
MMNARAPTAGSALTIVQASSAQVRRVNGAWRMRRDNARAGLAIV